MSDAHNEHESLIKTPKQLVAAVSAAFIVPIVAIVLLAHFVDSGSRVGEGSDAQSAEAVKARISPVADQGYTLKDANAPKTLQTGEAVYKAVCAGCHATGAAGAPKTGDAGSWAKRIGAGYDKLVDNAIKGLRAMPAKGGNPDLDDVEVARAVVFMANQSGGKFKEPEVKAPAAAAPAAAPAAPSAAAQSTPAVAAPAPAAAATPAANQADVGKKIYDASCQACHGTGAAGAPKFGDKAAWSARLKKGQDALHASAIKGIGAMPPKGGSPASDDEIKAAVNYLTASVK